MTILIKEHRSGAATLIRKPSGTNTSKIVEQWQRQSTYCQVHERLPAITWTTVDSDDIVDALIASRTL